MGPSITLLPFVSDWRVMVSVSMASTLPKIVFGVIGEGCGLPDRGGVFGVLFCGVVFDSALFSCERIDVFFFVEE